MSKLRAVRPTHTKHHALRPCVAGLQRNVHQHISHPTISPTHSGRQTFFGYWKENQCFLVNHIKVSQTSTVTTLKYTEPEHLGGTAEIAQ